jgi:hypothetical protein
MISEGTNPDPNPKSEEKFLRWAKVVTPLLSTVFVGGLGYYSGQQQNKPDHTKYTEKTEAAKYALKAQLERTREVFTEDKKYDPFLEGSALELAITEEITSPIRNPGVVIVLTPKDAGKTTRMARVVRTLTEEKKNCWGNSNSS